MAFKHHILFATDMSAKFGCYWLRIMPRLFSSFCTLPSERTMLSYLKHEDLFLCLPYFYWGTNEWLKDWAMQWALLWSFTSSKIHWNSIFSSKKTCIVTRSQAKIYKTLNLFDSDTWTKSVTGAQTPQARQRRPRCRTDSQTFTQPFLLSSRAAVSGGPTQASRGLARCRPTTAAAGTTPAGRGRCWLGGPTPAENPYDNRVLN